MHLFVLACFFFGFRDFRPEEHSGQFLGFWFIAEEFLFLFHFKAHFFPRAINCITFSCMSSKQLLNKKLTRVKVNYQRKFFRRAMWQAGDPTNFGRWLEIAALSNVWQAAISAGSVFQPAAVQSRFLLGVYGDRYRTRTRSLELGRRAERTRIRRAANGAKRDESGELEDCRRTPFGARKLGVGGAD